MAGGREVTTTQDVVEPITVEQVVAFIKRYTNEPQNPDAEPIVMAAVALLRAAGFTVTPPGAQSRTDTPPTGPTNYPGGRSVPLGPSAGSDALVAQARAAAAAEGPRGGAPAAAQTAAAAQMEGPDGNQSVLTGQIIPADYVAQAPGWAQANLVYADKMLGTNVLDESFMRRLETSGSAWERDLANWIRNKHAAIQRTADPAFQAARHYGDGSVTPNDVADASLLGLDQGTPLPTIQPDPTPAAVPPGILEDERVQRNTRAREAFDKVNDAEEGILGAGVDPAISGDTFRDNLAASWQAELARLNAGVTR